jgi:hypothetical protein
MCEFAQRIHSLIEQIAVPPPRISIPIAGDLTLPQALEELYGYLQCEILLFRFL